ncbi:uncharacterized protein NPIL_85521, partial [Nephila pilipes]
MKSLAGNSISDEIIKSLWLQRLPQQTQVILTISNDTLDKIAEMADKIIAVYSSSEICQVTKVGSLPNSASSFDRKKLDVLQADIAALTKKFDEFSRNTRSRSKSRGNDKQRRSRSNSARYEFCWLKPFFSDSSSETDCAINHKSNPVDKPTSPVKKKIRFAPLPIAPSFRFTRRGREVKLPFRY